MFFSFADLFDFCLFILAFGCVSNIENVQKKAHVSHWTVWARCVDERGDDDEAIRTVFLSKMCVICLHIRHVSNVPK